MFYDKRKYIVTICGGRGSIVTDVLRGRVEHLIISPQTEDTIWDVAIADGQGDELFKAKNIEGRLQRENCMGIGRDSGEKLTISFSRLTRNEPIKVILKIRELE